MRHRSIRAVYAYWNELRAGYVAPQRSQLDPRALAASLGDIFLVDSGTPDYLLRLAGSRLSEAFGTSLTHTSYFSLWREESVYTARYALDLSSEHGAPVLVGVNLHSQEPDSHSPGMRHLPAALAERMKPYARMPERRTVATAHGELILLPLLHHGKLGQRVLGAFALFDEIRQSPESPAKLEAITARSLAISARPRQPLGLVSADIAKTVVARRGHLVLMQGSKD